MSVLCRYFSSTNGCAKGKDCTFLHGTSSSGTSSSGTSSGTSSEHPTIGHKICSIVHKWLKNNYCPSNKIERFSRKITGMLLQMTEDEIKQFTDSYHYQNQRMNDALEAFREAFREASRGVPREDKLDLSFEYSVLDEMALSKKFLDHIISFLRETHRFTDIDTHLRYTTGLSFFNVSFLSLSKINDIVPTCVIPAGTKEERDFLMSLAFTDEFFQVNLRKALSTIYKDGYFTVKYIESIKSLLIQVKKLLPKV